MIALLGATAAWVRSPFTAPRQQPYCSARRCSAQRQVSTAGPMASSMQRSCGRVRSAERARRRAHFPHQPFPRARSEPGHLRRRRHRYRRWSRAQDLPGSLSCSGSTSPNRPYAPHNAAMTVADDAGDYLSARARLPRLGSIRRSADACNRVWRRLHEGGLALRHASWQ